MNLKTNSKKTLIFFPQALDDHPLQDETPNVTTRVKGEFLPDVDNIGFTIGRINPSRHNHRTFHLHPLPECCKNKECLRCYGGVFQKASPGELSSRDLFVRPKDLGKDIDTICAICLVSFAKKKFIWKLSCNHYFHYKCIGQWSNLEKYTCPLCRKQYEYP